MKTASSTYKMLRALGTAKYEIKVVQGGQTYGMDKLKSVTMSPVLTDGNGISVGGANSTECRIQLLEYSANWPRMAQFTVQFRIVASVGSTSSEWITAGTFYTDERSEDKYGNLSIIAYDKMLMMEQTWTDKIDDGDLPSTWPITAKAWATMIQNAELATFADLTQLDDTVAFVGLNTASTIRDVLKSIAAVHAGNWMMTASETLKLVQFEDPQTGRITDIAMSLYDMEDSPALDEVTGVRLETEAGVAVESGTDTGYVLKTMCEFASTTGVAALCLSKISGYEYQPFTATDAYLDPIVDVGDFVTINDITYQIMLIDWNFSRMPTATASAPYDQEVDHEYTVVSQDTKNYRKTLSSVDTKLGDYVAKSEFSTEINQNSQAITLIAESTCVTQNDFDQAISDLQNQIDGNIQTWSGNYVPTLSNAPASSWTTATDKAEHVGDLYFVNSDAGIPEAGNYYRFEENNGTYSWQLLDDNALTEALNAAAAAQASADAAQDTADEANATAQLKGRIWLVQPTPPYDKGDLWFVQDERIIKVCVREGGRQTGSFVASDWEKREKYTDDSALTTFIEEQYNVTIPDIQGQLDKKAETYYQAYDPQSEWGASVANVAIAGINTPGLNSTIGAEHKGDLWYRTTDKTTWYWNGTSWVQQDIPEEVFDFIDGKAQIFVSQPTTQQYYDVGDIWVNATYGTQYSNDILKCRVAKTAGQAFNINHWEKASKYTDDSALEDFITVRYQSDLEIKDREISAKVSKISPTGQTSFSWALNDSSHIWYSNNTEVMKVNSSGLTVKGNITATTGYIGGTAANPSSGFTISATNIRNGMTSLNDTSHNGIYLGTDGIALGKGYFKVTSAGKLTARDGYIGNGTSGFTIGDNSIRNGMTSLADTTHDGVYIGTNGIALGKGSFKVTSGGEITAKSGSIGGFTLNTTSLYNGKNTIGADTSSGVFLGTSGIALGNGTANHTFKVTSAGAMTVKYGKTGLSDTTNNGVYIGTDGIALGTDKFKVTSSGVITASSGTIGGFTLSGSAIYTSGQSSYGGTGDGIYIGSSGLRIGSKFKVDNQGNITAGNITAENGTFKGNVYAKNIQYTGDAGYLSGGAISAGTVYGGGSSGQIAQYTLSDYNTARSGGYGAYSSASFNSDVQGGLYGGTSFNKAVSRSSGIYPDYFCATTITALSGLTAGSDVYITLDADHDLALKQHYHTITVQDDGTVTFGQPTNDAPDPFNVADTKTFKDGVKAVTVKSFGYEQDDNQETDYTKAYVVLAYNGETTRTVGNLDNLPAYTAAQNNARPRSIVRRTNLATGQPMPDTWNSSTNKGYVYLRATSNNSGIYYDANIEVGTSSAIYQAGVTQGSSDVGIKTITAQTFSVVNTDKSIAVPDANTDYTSSNLRARVKIDIASGDTVINSVYARVSLDGTKAYNAGQSATITALAIGGRAVLQTNATNYNDFDDGYDCDLTGTSYRYTPTNQTYQVGRVEVRNASGTALKKLRVKIPAITAIDRGSYFPDYTTNHWKIPIYVKSGTTQLYTDNIIVDDVVAAAQSYAGVSWVQILTSDAALANKQVSLYCYNSENDLVYSGNVRVSYDDR